METESAQPSTNVAVNQEALNVNGNPQPQEEKQTSKSLNLNVVLAGAIALFLIIGAGIIFLSGNKLDSIKKQFNVSKTSQNSSAVNSQNSSVSSVDVDAEIKKAGEDLVKLDSSISNIDQGLNDQQIDLSQ